MKPSALLLCLLLVLLSPHGLAEPATIPTACCFTLINKRLTLQNLESYRRITSSKCPHKAVIFKTIQGKMICTDPKQKWVQTFMKILNQKLQLHRPT